MAKTEPVIIVHGGAGVIPDDDAKRLHLMIQEAAREGYKVLLMTGSAVDAAERAVCWMEDNPVFNAGHGSKLNAAGEIEMSAIIMEGKSLKSGAVTGVRDVKNPVRIARCVMEKTEHDFLIGKGMETFIDEMGIPRIDPSSLLSEQAVKQFQNFQKAASSSAEKKKSVNSSIHWKEGEHGTVGAVALDRDGNIACATSTGGLTGQRAGRVGDTPLIGCGAYCDNAIGGVSTTGIGEAILRASLASRTLLYMEQGLSSQDAATRALAFMRERTSHTSAGLIVLSAAGQATPVFTSPSMSWASIQNGRLSYGVQQGEVREGGTV